MSQRTLTHLKSGRSALKLAVVSIILLVMMIQAAFGQSVKVGEPAPDFAVPLLDGKSTVRLSDFKGHRVLIFTWASW